MGPGVLLSWSSLRRIYVWAAVAVLIGSRFTTRRLALVTKRTMTQAPVDHDLSLSTATHVSLSKSFVLRVSHMSLPYIHVHVSSTVLSIRLFRYVTGISLCSQAVELYSADNYSGSCFIARYIVKSLWSSL
jgi:hypothetical protein